jgi:hypothetical protein
VASTIVWQRGFCLKIRQDTAAELPAAPSCRQYPVECFENNYVKKFGEYTCANYLCGQMPKSVNSPNLKSVFASIAETRERKALYDVFLSDSIQAMNDGKSLFVSSEILKEFENWLGEYDGIVHGNDFKNTLIRLKNLETAILMYRSLLDPRLTIGEMKLIRNGNEKSYAFVRAPFFAPENIKNEIRVYMGAMDELGHTLEELKADPKFLARCMQQITTIMLTKLLSHCNNMAKK